MKKIFIVIIGLLILSPTNTLAYAHVSSHASSHVTSHSTSKSIKSSTKPKSETAKKGATKEQKTAKKEQKVATTSNSSEPSMNPFSRNFFLWYWLFGKSNDDDDKGGK